MKFLYITSVERHSGKTATCIEIGKRFKAKGYQIGYLKPVSLQPWWNAGELADEDASFVKQVLDLHSEVREMSPVVVTPQFLNAHLRRPDLQIENERTLMEKIQEACEILSPGLDILILEGGGSLREGYVIGLPTSKVVETLGGDVLAIVSYRDEVRLLDDALTAQSRLGDFLKCLLINRVPADALTFVTETAVHFLEKQGIPVLGVLPETRKLAALTLREIVEVLDAEILTDTYNPDVLVETLTVGAMTTDAALRRFRKQTNKAVITGGDRTDIQLAALETSTTCLILTGYLRPSPLIITQADDHHVAVLLVQTNTMETINAIENIFGKTRLGQQAKLEYFETLLTEHFDYNRLERIIGLNQSAKN